MQDLIKESASELERDFIYKNMGYEPNGYSIVIDKKDDCPISMEQILDWHTKQMEKAYDKGREDERKEIEEARRIEAIRMVQVPATMNGEWCSACGAWKQYGVADQHHCTGYKIT